MKHLFVCLVMICSLLLSNCGNFDDVSHQPKPGPQTPINPGPETPVNPDDEDPDEPGGEDPDDPGNEEPGNEEPGNEEPGNGGTGNGEPGNGGTGNGEPGNGGTGNEEPGNGGTGNGEPGNGQPGNGGTGNGEPGEEEPGEEEPGEEEPGNGGNETPGTVLIGTEPKDLPNTILNEIDTNFKPNYDVQYVELLINKNKLPGKSMEIVTYNQYRRKTIESISASSDPSVIRRGINVYCSKNDVEPKLTKTCIVTLIVDSKCIDAVCLNENPGSTWPVGYEYFDEIMQELYDVGVWRSRDGEVAGPQDCVDTSIYTTPAMSVQRREGTAIYHTADDWFIAERTFKKPNISP